MHTSRLIAESDQDIPHGKTVFTTGDGNQDILLRREHALLLDGPLDLALTDHSETPAAECGVVLAELDLRLTTTAFALHESAPRAASAAGDDVADFNRVVGFHELLIGNQFVSTDHHDGSG